MGYDCGDTIMSDLPFVHNLMENQKSLRCDSCLKLNNRLLKCSNCKSMYYCNRKCQRSDWSDGHRNECQIHSTFSHILNRDCDRLLLRLWLKITSNKSLEIVTHELYNGLERSFNDLMTHEQHILEDSKRMQCFHQICNRFKSCDLEFDFCLLLHLFGKICINSFSILNEDLNEIGSGVYICASVLNHSCEPNSSAVFSASSLEVRAIRQISANEEVVINYIDIKNDRNERRERLRRQYYFDCNCLKCCNHSDKNIDYSLVKSLDKQMDDMITDQSDWQKCYSVGIQSIPLYRQIYGDFHPDLTVQLMRVLKVKLLITIKENLIEEETKELIRKTKQSIEITHGFGHKVYSIFKNTIGI